MKWTEEENETIRELKSLGLTYKQIHDHLPKRSVRAISVQGAKIFGGQIRPLNTWTPEEEEKLVALRLSGIPYKDIAVELNRTYHSVKGKGIILMKTIPGATGKWTRGSGQELSDLTNEEREYIETGQLYLDL